MSSPLERANNPPDILGSLAVEKGRNKGVDYEYNELNQLLRKASTQSEMQGYFDRIVGS